MGLINHIIKKWIHIHNWDSSYLLIISLIDSNITYYIFYNFQLSYYLYGQEVIIDSLEEEYWWGINRIEEIINK